MHVPERWLLLSCAASSRYGFAKLRRVEVLNVCCCLLLVYCCASIFLPQQIARTQKATYFPDALCEVGRHARSSCFDSLNSSYHVASWSSGGCGAAVCSPHTRVVQSVVNAYCIVGEMKAGELNRGSSCRSLRRFRPQPTYPHQYTSS